MHNGEARLVNQVRVESATEMIQAVLSELEKGCDIFINAAAISDYTADKHSETHPAPPALHLLLDSHAHLSSVYKKGIGTGCGPIA